MSQNLPAVNLALASVGSSGPLSWVGLVSQGSPSLGVRAGRPTLRLFNESGCGLDITFDTGRSDRIPAGAWAVYQLAGEQSLTWTVTYVLPGAPVALLLAVLYEPGEAVPDTPLLGNSPIGIGGTVNTSTTDAVINDGRPLATQVIEATPSGAAGSQMIWRNDGSGVFGGGLCVVTAAGIFTAIPAGAIPLAALQNGVLQSGVIISTAATLASVIGAFDNGTGQLHSTVNARGMAMGYNDGGGTYHQVLGVDGAGNVTTIAPPTLTAGIQETNGCGVNFVAAAASNGQGIWTPFRCRMTNVPTGITLTPTTSVNVKAGSPTASGMTRDGFLLFVAANAAGTCEWLGTYTTVGN